MNRVLHVAPGSLRWRLLTATVATTTDRAHALRSRFTWGREVGGADTSTVRGVITPEQCDLYRLRVIGVLNGLFGTVIDHQVKERKQ